MSRRAYRRVRFRVQVPRTIEAWPTVGVRLVNLAAAVRVTFAAARDGHPDPAVYLRDELFRPVPTEPPPTGRGRETGQGRETGDRGRG